MHLAKMAEDSFKAQLELQAEALRVVSRLP
jgi:hypothetical protein